MLDPSNDPAPRSSPGGTSRRRFLSLCVRGAVGASLGAPLLAGRAPADSAPDPEADGQGATRLPLELLETSPYVYVSPLRSDGGESRCHGEVWFAWLDESVVVTVASDRWKARALARGLDRARLWVGDHGRWKGLLGRRNERFRAAPSFDAKAERVRDAALIDRLLTRYERKYPEEIDDWRERMKRGNADGTRIMIRYTPLQT